MNDKIKETAAAGSVGAGAIATAPSRMGAVKTRKLKSFMTDYYKKLSNRLHLFPVNLYKLDTDKKVEVVKAVNENFNIDSVFAQLSNFENQNSVEDGEVTTYGVEDDKGNLMKVTILNTQAEDFEAYISAYLSTLKDFDNQGVDLEEISLAELLYKLKDLFDIRDVEFPNIPDDIVYNADEASENIEDIPVEDDLDMGDADMEMGDEDELNVDADMEDGGDLDLDLDMEGEGEEEFGDEFSDDESVEDFEETGGETTMQSLLMGVLDMLSKTAEKEKAQAEAEAEKARAEQAEYTARAVDATLANKEELVAMQAEKDKQKKREKEAKKQADLATYRYKKANDMVDDASATFEWFEDDSLLLDALFEEAFNKRTPELHDMRGLGGDQVFNLTQSEDEIKDGDVLVTDWGPVIFVETTPVSVGEPPESYEGIGHELMGKLSKGMDWERLRNGKYIASYKLAKKYQNPTLSEAETIDDPVMLRRVYQAELQALRKKLADATDPDTRAALQKQMTALQRKHQIKRQEADARREEQEARAKSENDKEDQNQSSQLEPGQRNISEQYITEEISEEEYELLEEAAKRQFKRYGNKFVRKFRCYGGPKSGRMVTKMSDCGKRKDPFKVRQGKRASRMKKGQRVRKTKLAKKKSPSLRLVRMNKNLRGNR
jgi:hypothetical protein